MLCSTCWGVSWNYGDHRFKTEDSLYLSSPRLIMTVAKKISDHITYLKSNFLHELNDNFLIIFGQTEDADALFYPPNHYVDSQGTRIETAVIVINPRMLSNTRLFRLLGHELFHLVHDAKAPQEKSWIREGLAQNFEHDVYGGISQTHLRAAITDSKYALEEEFDISLISSEKYGNAFLFFHFLEQNCLSTQAWRSALDHASAVGREGLQVLLRAGEQKSSFCHNLLDVMGEFTLQKLINAQNSRHPIALWPLIETGEPMDTEGFVLGQLSTEDLGKFIDNLPSFLGFKISAKVWLPPVGPLSGIEMWYWAPSAQILMPWSDRPGSLSDDAQVIFFKKR